MLGRMAPFALFLFVVLACEESKPTNRSTPQTNADPTTQPAASPPAPSVIAITAHDLYAAYEANEVAADEAYKNKTLRVSGRIDSIGKDILDSMYVTLAAGAPYNISTVQCMFGDEHKESLTRLKKGQAITVLGVCNGKLGNVFVKECRLDSSSNVSK